MKIPASLQYGALKGGVLDLQHTAPQALVMSGFCRVSRLGSLSWRPGSAWTAEEVTSSRMTPY